jgi:type I restriction enzyme S subunit
MNHNWPVRRIADIMTVMSRPVEVLRETQYRFLGVRLDGNGPFHRETKFGRESSASTLYRVETGDFIYSRLFAWRGAFGIVGADLDGAHVSNEFPVFRINTAKADTRFINYIFRLPRVLHQVEMLCIGSTPTTRNRFHERFFLQLEIPLPPLPEQQRIVAWLDALATRAAAARALWAERVDDYRQLTRGFLFAPDAPPAPVPFSHLLTRRPLDVDVYPEDDYAFAGVYCFGRGMFRREPKPGSSTAYKQLTRVRAGEFCYPKPKSGDRDVP